jgi:predicted kinase
MPKCYQLIGVPGSGKSTWAHQQMNGELSNCVYVSTDQWVERYAASVNKTYDEVFDYYIPSAVRLMTAQVIRAHDSDHDIIWDQTSTNVTSRRKKFNLLPNYDHVAVVFRTPEPEEHARRLAQRPFKNIPKDVLARMAFNMMNEPPTMSEGFSVMITL